MAYLADNFKITKQESMAEVLKQFDKGNSGAKYDLRTQMLSSHNDFTSLDWYYNYLDSLSYLSRNAAGPYIVTMLSIGYIPIICLPACCTEGSIILYQALNRSELPYISVNPMSFVNSTCKMDIRDAWVNKLDIMKKYNISIPSIRSKDIVRRLLSE